MLIQAFGVVCTLGLLGFVLHLIREGTLKERYALVWLGASIAMLTLSLWRGLLHRTAAFFEVAYPPALLFFIAFLFLLVIVLHLTVVISQMSERIKALVHRLAMLEMELNITRPGSRTLGPPSEPRSR